MYTAWYDNRNKMNMKEMICSGVWDVLDAAGEFVREDERWHVVYRLVLNRKPLFYTANILVPCALIAFLSLNVFFLPAAEGEKITLAISIILALVVFMMLVSQMLPTTSTALPLLSKYLMFTFLVTIAVMLCTVLVIAAFFNNPRIAPMQPAFRELFLFRLPRFLFMKPPPHVALEMRARRYVKHARESLRHTAQIDPSLSNYDFVCIPEPDTTTRTSRAAAQTQQRGGNGLDTRPTTFQVAAFSDPSINERSINESAPAPAQTRTEGLNRETPNNQQQRQTQKASRSKLSLDWGSPLLFHVSPFASPMLQQRSFEEPPFGQSALDSSVQSAERFDRALANSEVQPPTPPRTSKRHQKRRSRSNVEAPRRLLEASSNKHDATSVSLVANSFNANGSGANEWGGGGDLRCTCNLAKSSTGSQLTSVRSLVEVDREKRYKAIVVRMVREVADAVEYMVNNARTEAENNLVRPT